MLEGVVGLTAAVVTGRWAKLAPEVTSLSETVKEVGEVCWASDDRPYVSAAGE